MKLPHVNQTKYKRKIERIKRMARSELNPCEWDRDKLHLKCFMIEQDKVSRISYKDTSENQFVKNYESKNIPIVIFGALEGWNLDNYKIDKLAFTYRHEKFKVGEDDDGKGVYMGFKYYLHYALKDPEGASIDDSPLYIFDSTFGKRTLHHSSRRSAMKETKHKYLPEKSQATCHLVDDYIVPKYFRDDLFSILGSRRPPFRWIVIGPERSGTGIHVDPLGTSAWNALLSGHKRHYVFNLDGYYSHQELRLI
jgi:histone arginine demethylase JMJD6